MSLMIQNMVLKWEGQSDTECLERHPQLSRRAGTLVIQVEQTLFRIHSYLLANSSKVLKKILMRHPSNGPHFSDPYAAPLHLEGSVAGWGCILSLFYRKDLFKAVTFTISQWTEILPIAQDYEMVLIKEEGVRCLLKLSWRCDPVELLLLAKRIGSYELYTRAVDMVAQGQFLSHQDARRLGFEAFYEVTARREKAGQRTDASRMIAY
ncbi:hypothetical protein FRC17_005520 [Serendipita sp. 399]|nr:hypothetical protein FRC17_005520 [Serendipita sp. 399]